jgi:hypothetical protein
MKRLACLTLALLLSGGAIARAQTKVAVLGIEVVAAPETYATCLTKKLKGQVKLTAEVTLVPGKGMDEIKLVMGCMDERPDCMARAGRSLNADKLLWGTLQKSEGGFDLTLKMLDVEEARILRRATKIVTVKEMKQSCGAPTVQEMARSFLASDRGSIKITANVRGAQVMLGLTVIGLTQTEPLVLRDLPPGKYKIKIEKAGYKVWEQEVEVLGGELREVQAEMVLFSAATPPPPEDKKPEKKKPGKGVNPWKIAFWSGAAVTVGMAVGMGVTGANVLGAQSDKESFIRDYRTQQGDNTLYTPQQDVCDEAAGMDATNRARIEDICDNGKQNATLSNVFLGLMLASAAATGFLYYKAYIEKESPAPPDEDDKTQPEAPAGEAPVSRSGNGPPRWLVSPTAGPRGAGLGLSLQF